MKKIFLPFAAVALLLSSCKDAAPKEELVINLQEKGAEVAPSMYGIFFEEINHAGDGGLYAELVKNRSFEELEMPEGYYAEGDVLHPKKVCNHISGEVREGSFRWTTEPVPGWTLSTKDAAEMKLTKEQPKFSTAPNNLKVTIKKCFNSCSLDKRRILGDESGERQLLSVAYHYPPCFRLQGKSDCPVAVRARRSAGFRSC